MKFANLIRAFAPPRRLDVRHIPRLGSEHAQEGGRIHRPCAHLGVVWLCDQTSVRCPEVLEFEDDGLEGGFLCHGYSSFKDEYSELGGAIAIIPYGQMTKDEGRSLDIDLRPLIFFCH